MGGEASRRTPRMLSLRVDGGDGGARGEGFGTGFARRKQCAPTCGNDWCVYLIALRLRVRSIGAIEPPKQTLTGPYRRVFAVKHCYKGLQLGTEGTEPNTSSAGKNRGRRRAPGCLWFFFRGVTALNRRSISTAVSLAPLQLRGLKGW